MIKIEHAACFACPYHVYVKLGEYFRMFLQRVGRSGHAIGAFLGAAVFELVKLFAAAYMTGIWQLLLGATLIIVILVAPEGIVGLLLKKPAARKSGAER